MCTASETIGAPPVQPGVDDFQALRWSRIRASHNKDDHIKLYQLLETSDQHPEVLGTVKEAVVKLQQIKQMVFFKTFSEHTKPYEDQHNLRTVDPVHWVHRALGILDLAHEDAAHRMPADEIVKDLTWDMPSLRAARNHQLAQDPERREVDAYVRFQDHHVTHYATPALLMRCADLERLIYSVCPTPYVADRAKGPWRGHLLERTLLRNNYGKLPEMHLQNLRHVRLLPEAGLSWDDGRFYSHLDLLGQIRHFHRLPVIESIAVDGITINGGADYLEHFPPHCSGIKRIHVGHSMLPSSLIAPLIRMPKRLEEFGYSVGGRDSNDGGHYLFSAKTLGKALGDQKASLRKIDVDVDKMLSEDRDDLEEYEEYLEEMADPEGGPWWYDEWFYLDEKASTGQLEVFDIPDDRVYDETIGSLHDFGSLTHLSVGIKLLLGPPETKTPFRLIEALPKSLEYLLIRGYTKGEVAKYDEAIGELIEQRLDKLPALREVHGVEECIPSTDVEQTQGRRWGSDAEDEDAVEYWELDESGHDWLEA